MPKKSSKSLGKVVGKAIGRRKSSSISRARESSKRLLEKLRKAGIQSQLLGESFDKISAEIDKRRKAQRMAAGEKTRARFGKRPKPKKMK